MTEQIDIIKAIAESGIKKYRIAHAMGITDSWFSKMLRFPDELSQEKKEQIINAIQMLKNTEG